MSLMTVSSESAELLTRPRYSRCRGVSSVSRASSVMPMMPFIGVRISWLMLARNSLLARLAASAASLATPQLLLRALDLGDVGAQADDSAVAGRKVADPNPATVQLLARKSPACRR